MAIGFIDTATINSALRALNEENLNNCTNWDIQCLHNVTHLLMHDDIYALPVMGTRKKLAGLYERALQYIPSLERFPFTKKDLAEKDTEQWIDENISHFKQAWSAAIADNNFNEWSESHKQYFFVPHVITHGSLFEENFIPYIAQVLNCSEGELKQEYNNSSEANIKVVEEWERQKDSEHFPLVYDAWRLGGMMRGVYHENLATKEGFQLLPHPFRKWIGRDLKSHESHSVSKCEQLIVTAIIHCSRLERSFESKVDMWIKYIHRAGAAILKQNIEFEDWIFSLADEQKAIEAIKIIYLKSTSKEAEQAINIIVSYLTGGLKDIVNIEVEHWTNQPLDDAAARELNRRMNKTIESKIASHIFTPERLLTKLSDIPGRIKCNYSHFSK